MKLISAAGFMMISVFGTWVGPIPATQGPEMASFIPAGQLPQTMVRATTDNDEEDCL